MDRNAALEVLYHTHASLRDRLPALATALHRLQRGVEDPRAEVAAISREVTRLRDQVEAHFRQEEANLFPLLVRTLPELAGPVSGLLAEHDDMRYLLNRLLAALERIPVEAGAVEEAFTCASRYLRLLGDHSELEERTFFRYAREHLSDASLETLAAALAPEGE